MFACMTWSWTDQIISLCWICTSLIVLFFCLGLQGYRRGVPQDSWRLGFRFSFSPCLVVFVWRLTMNGFVSRCGSLLFHGFFCISEAKQDPSTSVKEQLSIECKGAYLCSGSLSLLLPVSSPHPSDSRAAYLGLMKGALWGASLTPHNTLIPPPPCPPARPLKGQLERNFTLG